MRYIVLLLVLLVGAGFVFINWPAVNAPAEVNLLITTPVFSNDLVVNLI